MTKHFERRTQSGPAQWKFEMQRTWSPQVISNPAPQAVKVLEQNKASDDPLRALVDACISNVAVLDESGGILYASKAWRLFRQDTPAAGNHLADQPGYFESCRRITESEFSEDAGI